MYENYFEDFCQHAIFRSYVKDVVNRELYNYEPKMNRKIDERLDSILVGKVSNEICKQLPLFLSRDYEVRNILKKHSENLQNTLDDKVRDIVKNITSEEDYHTINRAYFDEFKNKGDLVINNLKSDYCKKMNEFESEMKTINQYRKKIENLESDVRGLRSAFFTGCITIIGLSIYRLL